MVCTLIRQSWKTPSVPAGAAVTNCKGNAVPTGTVYGGEAAATAVAVAVGKSISAQQPVQSGSVSPAALSRT